jgi:hypothetical protein
MQAIVALGICLWTSVLIYMQPFERLDQAQRASSSSFDTQRRNIGNLPACAVAFVSPSR